MRCALRLPQVRSGAPRRTPSGALARAAAAATSSTCRAAPSPPARGISRTIVASTPIATALPRPISLIDGSPVPTNTRNTQTMISARRCDRARARGEPLRDRQLGVVGGLVALADARQQEHLVVHRQAEHDRQHERRRQRVDVAGRLEAEETVDPAPLEDRDQHPVGGADRQQVHHQRLQRQDRAAQQDQQHDVGTGRARTAAPSTSSRR